MARRQRPSLTILAPSAAAFDGGEAGPDRPPGPAPAASGPADDPNAAQPCPGEGWAALARLAQARGIAAEALVREMLDAMLAGHRRSSDPAGDAFALAVQMLSVSATWPIRTGTRLWYHAFAAPVLTSWARWADLVEIATPRPASDRPPPERPG